MKTYLMTPLMAALLCGVGCAPSGPSATPPSGTDDGRTVREAATGISPTSTPEVPGMVYGTSTAQTVQPQPTIGTEELKEKTGLYEITAKFPVLAGLADDAAQKTFNDRMRADATTSVKAFKDYFEDVDRQAYLKDFQSFYEMDFKTVASGRYLSVIMTGSEYSGGAHPAAIYRTYVFDLAGGKFLELEDLFAPGSDYLAELSSSTLAEIAKLGIGDAAWNKNGTAPQAENFQFFWLADDGLHILFPPYQVASYAEGEHEIMIPFSHLKSFVPAA